MLPDSAVLAQMLVFSVTFLLSWEIRIQSAETSHTALVVKDWGCQKFYTGTEMGLVGHSSEYCHETFKHSNPFLQSAVALNQSGLSH